MEWLLDSAEKYRCQLSPEIPQDRTICEIRVLGTVAELIESYKLRYEVYGALGYLRRFNASKLEIDEYDSSSIPFGAFDPRSGAMIGTLRLITAAVQRDYEHLVRCVIAELGDIVLAKQALGPQPRPLPSIVSDETHRQIEAFNTDRLVVHELSRTIVRPGHRGMGVSRGLMEFGLAYASRCGPVTVVGGCVPTHLPMYAKFGYHALPYTGLELFESVGQIANTVICRTDVLPQPTRSHVDELLRSMSEGAAECTLEIGRDAQARYRLAAPRRIRQHTIEL